MLADGIEPSSILCLTYSDAAANEMRQRLIKKMGVIASSVDIYTKIKLLKKIQLNYSEIINLTEIIKLLKKIHFLYKIKSD